MLNEHELGPMPDEYFIQDTRSYVGNCVLWWRAGGRGYTTDINKAGRFDHSEAMAQHNMRETDKPWKCSDIEPLARATIDMQDLKR